MSYLFDACVISELVRAVPEVRVLHWLNAWNEYEFFMR